MKYYIIINFTHKCTQMKLPRNSWDFGELIFVVDNRLSAVLNGDIISEMKSCTHETKNQ